MKTVAKGGNVAEKKTEELTVEIEQWELEGPSQRRERQAGGHLELMGSEQEPS